MRSPWLGLVFAAYAAVVLVGSVHLGWHYAVDGYVSIVATLAIGWAVDVLLSRNARVSDA
jgi:PAP2 superfamily